jgi:membrane-bound lytic murein transglycosylase D
MIRERLRAAGLPEDLTYLAFAESFYDPDAYSKAAAVGMWQFMTRTALGMGMRVDWWVDERRDPVRATENAARLLKALYARFGSHYLAAAAYNGGPARVSSSLARYAGRLEGVEGDDRFFVLARARALRPETRDYVPKIIALALIAKTPERYGLRVDSLPPWRFDSVRVAGETPIASVAAAIGLDVGAVQELNPHLLRGLTPAGDPTWVRVPSGLAAEFAERYAALDSAQRVGVRRVRSKSGESMTSVARRHGLTARQLGWYNPRVVRLKSGNLRAGQTILVPSPAAIAGARDVPNPAIERYQRRVVTRR